MSWVGDRSNWFRVDVEGTTLFVDSSTISTVAPIEDIVVRLNDGIEIQTRSLGTIKCDARRPDGDINLISHAHTDHLPTSIDTDSVVCSSVTASLAQERRNLDGCVPSQHDAIELHPAGHIDGSRAALIQDGDVDILFTGDVSVRDRWGLDGFDPISADILILEATYGSPEYTFPSCDDVEQSVADWLASRDGLAILYAYALGKAQRVQHLLDRVHTGRVFVTENIAQLDAIIAEHEGDGLETAVFEPSTTPRDNDVIVTTRTSARTDWFQDCLEEHPVSTAGCSGWALDSGYIYRGRVDAGFPMSDHCDFAELLDLVREVDPEVTYLHHGFRHELARALTREGFDARALQRHQSTLEAYS